MESVKGREEGNAETCKALPGLPTYLPIWLLSHLGSVRLLLFFFPLRTERVPDPNPSNRPRPSRIFGSAAEPDYGDCG